MLCRPLPLTTVVHKDAKNINNTMNCMSPNPRCLHGNVIVARKFTTEYKLIACAVENNHVRCDSWSIAAWLQLALRLRTNSAVINPILEKKNILCKKEQPEFHHCPPAKEKWRITGSVR